LTAGVWRLGTSLARGSGVGNRGGTSARPTGHHPNGLRPPALEEVAHLGEEALMVWAVFGALLGFRLELLQQLALLRTEVLRRFDRDLNEHVAALGAAQDREPLPRSRKLSPV